MKKIIISNDKKRLKPYQVRLVKVGDWWLYGRVARNKHGAWLDMYPLQGLQRWLKPPRETLRMFYLKRRRFKV